jgi:two-component system sensor histidine kinase RegB
LSIKHALINIIENGIKEAKDKVTLELRVSRAGLTITIADDGPGIPAEVMENLGEPFISVRNQGMGLGIYLANASISRLGGSIEMRNRVEGGAVTRITLPLAKLTDRGEIPPADEV